jgi:hypothetical protein
VEGFPLITIGTLDMCRKFHIIAMAISSHEDTSAYTFCLQTLVDTCSRYLKFEFHPQAAISNAAMAIKNFIDAVFGTECKKITCWVHVVRNLKSKVPELVSSKENANEI